MRLAAALCVLVSCGDSSHSASERREEPVQESDAERIRRETVENPDVVHMLSAVQPWLSDHHLPTPFAAIDLRRPGEEIVLEWAKRHLDWEALEAAAPMFPDVELARNTVMDGRLGCITGQLRTLEERDGAWEFTLAHPTPHLSAGWIVKETAVSVGDPVEVCGVVTGRLMQGRARGFHIIGRVRRHPPGD